jgi:hypothetical protein
VLEAISLIFFSRRCMSCTLFSQTSRASGSLISSASFTRPGKSLGRNGAASARSIKIEKETTHFIRRWTRVEGTARRDAASAPLASSTSFDMLQIIRAAWRFRAVAFGPRSPSARDSNGTTTASVGESTLWTNVVAARACTVASTSLGLDADDTSLGMTCARGA